MMNTDLKQTEFCIEKLQTVVNVGGLSAYQILTFSGHVIGRLCEIPVPETQSPANDADFNSLMTAHQPIPWIQRVFSALRG